MAEIILDFGSGNTSQNSIEYVKQMIDELKAVDTGKHEIIIKWQLFQKVGNNIPLEHSIFAYAYNYANCLGYKTTASVFDKESLDFLLQFDVPFVKIANNRELDWIISEVPRNIDVYVSVKEYKEYLTFMQDAYSSTQFYETVPMCCVSKYPCRIQEYEDIFCCGYEKITKQPSSIMKNAVSDHTTNWDLFNKYKPEIYECHFCLEHDENNPDGGLFSRTPEQLKEVL